MRQLTRMAELLLAPVLRAAVLVAPLALAQGALAGDPVAALPGGAQVLAFLDLTAWRSSAALASLDSQALGESFGMDSEFLSGFGAEGRFDRVAIGGFPLADGKDMSIALIVDGVWDQAAMMKSLLDRGAVEVAVAGKPSYRLPKDGNGDDFVLSFLGEGRLGLSEWDLAEAVRSGGGSLSKALATEVAGLPKDLSAWMLVADPLSAGAATGVDAGVAGAFAGGLKSLSLWARAAGAIELGASALAADTAQASQLSALVQLGLMGLSMQGGQDWTQLLSTLKLETSGERLNLGLKLDPEQVARLASLLKPEEATGATP